MTSNCWTEVQTLIHIVSYQLHFWTLGGRLHNSCVCSSPQSVQQIYFILTPAYSWTKFYTLFDLSSITFVATKYAVICTAIPNPQKIYQYLTFSSQFSLQGDFLLWFSVEKSSDQVARQWWSLSMFGSQKHTRYTGDGGAKNRPREKIEN